MYCTIGPLGRTVMDSPSPKLVGRVKADGICEEIILTAHAQHDPGLISALFDLKQSALVVEVSRFPWGKSKWKPKGMI